MGRMLRQVAPCFTPPVCAHVPEMHDVICTRARRKTHATMGAVTFYVRGLAFPGQQPVGEYMREDASADPGQLRARFIESHLFLVFGDTTKNHYYPTGGQITMVWRVA